MVKNWLILGDEAFDSDETPMGIFRFTYEEMKDWQNIAWKQFADIVNNNKKVKRMVFGSNFLYLGAVFSIGSGVTNKDVDDFADFLYQNIDDLEYCTVDYTANHHKDDGTLILAFGMFDEEKLQNLMPTHYTYIKGDIIVPDFRNFNNYS